METAIQKPQAAAPKMAIDQLAERLGVSAKSLWESVKNTAFKGAKDEELVALMIVANEYGLNPFLRQVYAFPAKGGGIVPVVGIDGWVAIVNRQKSYNGVEFTFEAEDDGSPVSCTCRMYVKGRDHPVAVTERYSECFRPTEPWKGMPWRMLRHKAFIQAARYAFGLSGIYDADEAQDVMKQGNPLSVIEPIPEVAAPKSARVRQNEQAIAAERSKTLSPPPEVIGEPELPDMPANPKAPAVRSKPRSETLKEQMRAAKDAPVVVDSETGEITEPSPEEQAEILAAEQDGDMFGATTPPMRH